VPQPPPTDDACAAFRRGEVSGGSACLPPPAQTERSQFADTQIALNRAPTASSDEILQAVKGSPLNPNQLPRTSTQVARPKVGDKVTLQVPTGARFVPVARTYEDLLAFVQAAKANDTYGIDELVRQQGVFVVASGTSALILTFEANHGDAYRIRLTSGVHINEIGFVPLTWATVTA